MGVGPSSESHKAQYNVAVLGAAGGIGQTLSLLMKQSKFIKSLRLCEFSRVSQIFILLMVLSFPTHQKIPLDDDRSSPKVSLNDTKNETHHRLKRAQ